MVVANAMKVKLIAETRVKTDKRDTLVLARLVTVGLIPGVWVPPLEVRELRGLIAHRRQMVKRRTMVKNRMHGILHRHQVLPPEGDPFAVHNRGWWVELKATPTEKLHLKHDLAALQQMDEQIGEAEAEVERLSTEKPWGESLPYLLQLPGFGVLTAMIVLGAIGDIGRFETDKQLVGYAGLGASVHSSGQTHRTGRITKQGRKDLRWVLVEAAWVAVQKYPHWQATHERLSRRMHPNQAVVAIARHLLVAVWHVLTERAADKHADPQLVATKMMRWSWSLTDEQRGGLTSRQFIRYHLLRFHYRTLSGSRANELGID